MIMKPTEARGFLKDLPAQNKDNFRIYHEQGARNPATSKQGLGGQSRASIYPTTPDAPTDQRIVNEPKQQVTLKYLRFRGVQYGSQSQSVRNPAKRKKTNGAKAHQ